MILIKVRILGCEAHRATSSAYSAEKACKLMTEGQSPSQSFQSKVDMTDP